MIDEPLQRLGCESKCLGQKKDVDWRQMLPNFIEEVSSGNYWIVNDYCNGTDCCQVTIPSSLQVFDPKLRDIDDNQSTDGCQLAFLAGTYEVDSWTEKDRNVQFPMVLDWVINSTLREDYQRTMNSSQRKGVVPKTFYCYYYGSSSSSNKAIFRCSCKPGYDGNPYLECTVRRGDYWSVGNSLWYLDIVQACEEKKENRTQKKVLQKEWWVTFTTTTNFK
ncbi:hypothetical protein GH714_027519 [Hevea brasiliensis]|uniref:Wall-associated receptor kinase domain-containing protein n=1 Tax=Hevea brasiliensis TaxID=3981 RepID=A0A6A6LKR6_HEVBR|nr:hypothetical protein GH714_027519 [Hevea brasiliensis]